MPAVRRTHRFWILLVSIVAILAAAGEVGAGRKGKKGKKAEPRTADDLVIVDCLLPGQVRQLGNRATYVTARRPIRTTAIDCRIRGGEYVAEDRGSYAGALHSWMPAAEAGDAEAQAYVGEIFEKGPHGVPDYTLAAAWYRKAAEQGNHRAMVDLANLYEKGLGVDPDPAKALEWYRRSAGISEAVALDWSSQEAELRGEMGSLRAELDAVQKHLEAATSRLEEARSEVERLRRELDAARQTNAPAAETGKLSDELEQRESDAREIRDTLETYRQRLERLKAIETGQVAGPTITIVEPEVLATRGPMLVPVPADAGEVRITGQVTAPAGLETLTGGPLVPTIDADANGFFDFTVACRERTELTLEASDRQGRKTAARLILEPGAHAPAPPVSASAAGTAPAPGPILAHRYALVIAVAAYQNLVPLKTAAADGEAVARVLRDRYGYATTLLSNPTHFEMLRALNSLRETLTEDDSLLIYYAGHGKIADGKGYWVGTDGGAADPARWLPNEAVSDMIDVMKARHVLVVSDSCYSGTLTRSGLTRVEAGLDEAERAARLEEVADQRSRTVLTSGGLQPVLDEGGGEHSLFARAFLRVLELAVDPLPGAELHREVATRVRFRALQLGIRQKPDYAPIQHAGHEAGDFVLAPARG